MTDAFDTLNIIMGIVGIIAAIFFFISLAMIKKASDEQSKERWKKVRTATSIIAFIAFVLVVGPIIVVSVPSF